MQFQGNFHLPYQSRLYNAWVNGLDDGQLQLICPEAKLDVIFSREQFALENSLPNLPIAVRFHDDSVFTPRAEHQETFRRWCKPHQKDKVPAWLESHRRGLILSLFALPLLLIAIYLWGIPALAKASVSSIPYIVQKQVGDQTLLIIEKSDLSPSEIPISKQQAIESRWRYALNDLGVQNSDSFKLLFRQSISFRDNAFALTNHTIVITDSLIYTLDQDPDQILSVLLHETGHIVYKHGVEKLLESVYTTLATTLFLGDTQDIADAFISVGTGVVNNSFSRDMERQADQFALEGLRELNISTQSFADAMANLDRTHNRGKASWLTQLFSSHPETQERIEAAQE